MVSQEHLSYVEVPVTFDTASRELSQATTEDDRMLVNQLTEQQRHTSATHQDIEVQGVLIKAQTPSTLFEDHLRYAEKAFKRHENEAVQAFVSGTQEAYRIPLEKKLEEHGQWTWQAAMEEGQRMVEAQKKTMRRSARFMAGTYQPS